MPSTRFLQQHAKGMKPQQLKGAQNQCRTAQMTDWEKITVV
jgi:hypothetical protein